jgi:alpha-N-arabinofuranosidase
MASSHLKMAVWMDQRHETVSPLLHGFSLEHLGHVIYEGVWIGQSTGYSRVTGHRTKLVNALRQLNPGIVKWPGGLFSNTYHWEDGKGPIQKRPKKENKCWGGVESNQFGTDEFLRLCEKIDAEPYICLNTESGNVQEAIGWLSYCNTTKRPRSGSDHYRQSNPLAPKVRYWKIGNGPSELNNGFDPIAYGKLFKTWGFYLKERDNSVQLVAPIRENQAWMARFFETLTGYESLLDYISLSTLSSTEPFGRTKPVTEAQYYGLFCYLPLLENRIIQIHRILNLYSKTDKAIRLVLDNWGIQHTTVQSDTDFKQVVTLRDSLFAACILHLYYRFSDVIALANLNYLVNALHTLFFTKDETLVRTPTYYVLDLLKDHVGSQRLKIRTSSSKQHVSNHLGAFELPLLDVFASWNEENYRLTITMINLNIDNELEIHLSVRGGGSIEGGTAVCLTGKSPNDQNNLMAPDRITPQPIPIERINNPIQIKLAPHSLTKLRLQIQ